MCWLLTAPRGARCTRCEQHRGDPVSLTVSVAGRSWARTWVARRGSERPSSPATMGRTGSFLVPQRSTDPLRWGHQRAAAWGESKQQGGALPRVPSTPICRGSSIPSSPEEAGRGLSTRALCPAPAWCRGTSLSPNVLMSASAALQEGSGQRVQGCRIVPCGCLAVLAVGHALCCTSGGVLPSPGFRSTCLCLAKCSLPWLSILLQHLGALTSPVDNHPALQAWAIQGLSSFFSCFSSFLFFFHSFLIM